MLFSWAIHGLAAAPTAQSADQTEPTRQQLAAQDTGARQAKHKPEPQVSSVTAQQAAYNAQDQFGGRVLSVKLEDGEDGPYYQVKLLKHGQVRVVRTNTQH